MPAARQSDRRLGAGVSVLQEAGVAGTPGVVTGETGAEALAALQQLLPAHRVWERFPASVT
jgi:catalase